MQSTRLYIIWEFLKLFTLRESRQGGDELRTSVYPSNFAPIATKFRQRAFQTICKFRFFDAENFFSENNLDSFFGFSLFSADFRGARLFLTSKSSSSRFFALDGQIFRSVRRLGLIFRLCTVRTWGSIRYRTTFLRLWRSTGITYRP